MALLGHPAVPLRLDFNRLGRLLPCKLRCTDRDDDTAALVFQFLVLFRRTTPWHPHIQRIARCRPHSSAYRSASWRWVLPGRLRPVFGRCLIRSARSWFGLVVPCGRISLCSTSPNGYSSAPPPRQ